jgi:hypothetical protein
VSKKFLIHEFWSSNVKLFEILNNVIWRVYIQAVNKAMRMPLYIYIYICIHQRHYLCSDTYRIRDCRVV